MDMFLCLPAGRSWSGLVIMAVARERTSDAVHSRSHPATCGSFKGRETSPCSPGSPQRLTKEMSYLFVGLLTVFLATALKVKRRNAKRGSSQNVYNFM